VEQIVAKQGKLTIKIQLTMAWTPPSRPSRKVAVPPGTWDEFGPGAITGAGGELAELEYQGPGLTRVPPTSHVEMVPGAAIKAVLQDTGLTGRRIQTIMRKLQVRSTERRKSSTASL